MLRFSKKFDYTIGIVTELSKNSGFCSSHQLSETLSMPKSLTAVLLKKLCQHQIVVSERGANGGYRLNKQLSEINFFALLELIEGRFHLTDCAINNCFRQQKCLNQHGFSAINQRFKKMLDMNMAEFLSLAKKGASHEAE